MSSKFRDMLEKRLQEEILERADSFVESRNGDVHETGRTRGYLVALREVLQWCQEIERKLNDA